MTPEQTTSLVQTAVEIAPQAIALLREAFTRKNSDAPTPTNEEVISAFNIAYQSSLDKDDLWTSTHPDPPTE